MRRLDWIFIIICTIFFMGIVIITDNAPSGIMLSLVLLGLFLLGEKFFGKQKNLQKFINYGNSVWGLFVVLVILDKITTYLGVHHFKIGYETNQFLLFLWGKYGYWLGEGIHLSSLLITFFLIYLLTKNKNNYVATIFLLVMCVIDISFVSAVLNNIYILLKWFI